VVALVATFVAKGLLVGISEPAVPWKEVAGVMDLDPRISNLLCILRS
jgi:hypothetical protein